MAVLIFETPEKAHIDVQNVALEVGRRVATIKAACVAGSIKVKDLNDAGARLVQLRKRLVELEAVTGLADYAEAKALAKGVADYDVLAESATVRSRIVAILTAAADIALGEVERVWQTGDWVDTTKATTPELLAACEAAAGLTTAV